MLSVKIFGSIVLVGALFATAACSDSSKSLNPTAPSAVAAASLNVEAADAIAESGATAGRGNPGKPENPGNGNGNGNGSGNDDRGKGNDDDKGKAPSTTPPASNTPPPGNTTPGAPTAPTNPVTGKVEIEGLISAIAGTSITVNGQVVMVPTGTVIRHGSRAVAFSALAIGDRVHVKALMQATGLEATEVKLQHSRGDDDDDDTDDDDDNDDEEGVGTVRVSIVDATGSEAGDTAAFRLTRVVSPTLPLTSSLTVTFALTGTATNGVDYTTIPVTVMFPAGQATVNVTVTPVADALAEAAESVTLTLTSVAPYVLGTPTTATVTIVNVGG